MPRNTRVVAVATPRTAPSWVIANAAPSPAARAVSAIAGSSAVAGAASSGEAQRAKAAIRSRRAQIADSSRCRSMVVLSSRAALTGSGRERALVGLLHRQHQQDADHAVRERVIHGR